MPSIARSRIRRRCGARATRGCSTTAPRIARRARAATRAVLVVPSLINRWEVLDLTAEKSLLRAMAAAGLRPYLVDWGTPNDEERRFDTHRLCRAPRARARLHRQAGAAGAGGDGLLHGRHAHRGAGRAPAAPRRGAGAARRPLGLPCRPHRPCLPASRPARLLARDGRPGGRAAGRYPADPVLVARSLARREEVRPLPRHGPAGRLRPRLRAARGLAERRRAARRPDGARMPGRLVRRQPARHRQMGGRRPAHRAVQDQRAGAGHDPVGRSHRAALSAAALADPKRGLQARHATRPAARPYRHGGERPRPRSLLDAADRLAGRHSCQSGPRDDGGRAILRLAPAGGLGRAAGDLDGRARPMCTWPTRRGAASPWASTGRWSSRGRAIS